MSAVRVLGVGSPFGDDQVGWRVVEALAVRDVSESPPRQGHRELVRVDRPGPELLGWIRGAERVVIVDAVLDSEAPGRVLELDPERLASERAPLSGHTFGVAETLELLAALGDTPRELHLVAITIGEPDRGTELSRDVAAAVPHAVRRVEALLAGGCAR